MSDTRILFFSYMITHVDSLKLKVKDAIVSSFVLGKAGLSKTHVIAATTVGTTLEFYDFTIYSFFAIRSVSFSSRARRR
ncbi:MAG: Uncharacterized MFS-type transporter [uncultured Caballeronia sp.]|nr:MAG: Uncharacterized MFS-type transporter [uncultured Caballeronia sp.]